MGGKSGMWILCGEKWQMVHIFERFFYWWGRTVAAKPWKIAAFLCNPTRHVGAIFSSQTFNAASAAASRSFWKHWGNGGSKPTLPTISRNVHSP